jgi:hypothetical protein
MRPSLRLTLKSIRVAGRASTCWTAPARGIRIWSDGLWNQHVEELLPGQMARGSLFTAEPVVVSAAQREATTAARLEKDDALLMETLMAEAPMVSHDATSAGFGRVAGRAHHHHRRHSVDNPANNVPSLPNGAVNFGNNAGKTPSDAQPSLWPKWGKRGLRTSALLAGKEDANAGAGKDFTRSTFYTPNIEDASRRIPTQKDYDAAAKASGSSKGSKAAGAPVTSFDVSESTGYDTANINKKPSSTAQQSQNQEQSNVGQGQGMEKMAREVEEMTEGQGGTSRAGIFDSPQEAFTGAALGAKAIGNAASKVGSAASSVRQEMEKPASQVVEDAERVIGSAAGRVAGATAFTARTADAPVGGDEDIGAGLRETLEVRSEYPPETGVTPPSYLHGGRDDPAYRDPDELVTELEESAGLYEETGVTAPSSINIKAPLKGPGVEGASTKDIRHE